MIFKSQKLKIVFYEKPGCTGNARQKRLLKQCGYELDVRDMLSTLWSIEKLQSFFYALEKEDIVNKFSPDIKNNLLNIDEMTKDDLILKMIEKPLLIKRPLMIFGDYKLCGFNTKRLSKLLNVDIALLEELSNCTGDDLCKSV